MHREFNITQMGFQLPLIYRIVIFMSWIIFLNRASIIDVPRSFSLFRNCNLFWHAHAVRLWHSRSEGCRPPNKQEFAGDNNDRMALLLSIIHANDNFYTSSEFIWFDCNFQRIYQFWMPTIFSWKLSWNLISGIMHSTSIQWCQDCSLNNFLISFKLRQRSHDFTYLLGTDLFEWIVLFSIQKKIACYTSDPLHGTRYVRGAWANKPHWTKRKKKNYGENFYY